MNKKYELVKTDTLQTPCGKTLFRVRALIAIGLSVSAGDLGGYIESEQNLQVYGNAWVYGDARVYGNACVSGDARVYGNACVSGDALVRGNAQVYGNARVCGNAQVHGDARVRGNAQVYGDAWVCDNACVYGNAWVCDNAWVSGDACVSGDARVRGNAQVHGDARVCGNAQVHGDARVCGNAQVCDNSSIVWFTKFGYEKGTLTVCRGENGLVVTRGCFCGSVDEFFEASNKKHDEKTKHEYRLLIEVANSRLAVSE